MKRQHKPCPGCIDRMVWHLWPGTIGGFRDHTCSGKAIPFASEWAPDHLHYYWMASYALAPDPLLVRCRDRELAEHAR